MQTFLSSLSTSDIIILLLAVTALLSRPFTYFACQLHAGPSPQIRMGILITKHCWLAAVLVIASFAVETVHQFTNLYTPPLSAEVHLYLLNGIQILRSAFSLWLVIRLSDALYHWLHYMAMNELPTLKVILPQIKNSLKFSFVALLFVLLIPDFFRTAANAEIIAKLTSMLIIWAITWLLIQTVMAFEQLTLQHYNELSTDNYKARGIYTKVKVFKKIAIGVVIILAAAASLTVFESLREIGAGLLTSAGLATVVVGFAAQKTLGNIFAGLQIAITQPIKINDAVIIENEYGTVEEINMTYVVVKLWDLRRMVLPINYFLEKPFQNWTRKSASLLGVIFIYTDFSLPLEPVREAFMKILHESALWDKAVGVLQVSDATGNVMQLRALASAKDAPTAWDLRCEVREKLIAFIAKNYPQCLPRARQENHPGNMPNPYETRSNISDTVIAP